MKNKGMVITNAGIESMGFVKYPDDDMLEAGFHMLTIYSIEGLSLEDSQNETISNIIQFTKDIKAVICNNINVAFQKIFGFSIDYDKSSELSKYSLLLVLHYSSDKIYKIYGGYRKEDTDLITTYNEFSKAKEDFSDLEKRHIPSIISAMYVSLSEIHDKIIITLRKKEFFGATFNKKTISDITMDAQFNISSSYRINLEKLNYLISSSQKIKNNIDNKSVSKFHIAYSETDPLRKFIYYFFFIEKYTHKTYDEINKQEVYNVNIPERLEKTGLTFFVNQQKSYKNLAQRFNFCALVSWDTINDEDIKDFLYIKKMRDKLSHGEDDIESNLPIEKIEKLALKLLNQSKSN